MIVYRFERNGLGPYVGGLRVTKRSFYVNDSKRRTSRVYQAKFEEMMRKRFEVDHMKTWGKAHRSKDYMFGCSSKDGLRMYFRGNFKPLFQDGYRIKKYKVPDEEVLDMGAEVAFPVKYHKLQSLSGIRKRRNGYI